MAWSVASRVGIRGCGLGEISLALVRRNALDLFYELSLLGLWSSGVASLAFSTLAPDVFLAAAILGIAVRFVLTVRSATLDVRPALVDVITILFAGIYPFDLVYGSRDFVFATIHLVLSLGTLRFISAKSERDLYFVKILSFMAILAAALVSANLSFLFFLSLSVIFAVATFASSEIKHSIIKQETHQPKLAAGFAANLAKQTIMATIAIFLCALFIFFVLPRTARAAMSRFVPAGLHLTGFSNEVRLGAIGQLQQQHNLIFHAKLDPSSDGQPLDGTQLKWRGAALGEFDGRRWFNRSRQAAILILDHGLLLLGDHSERIGRRFHYEVQLAGVTSDVLFLAGWPEFIRVPASSIYRVNGNTFRLPSQSWDHVRYEVDTVLQADEADGSTLDEVDRAAYLQLPAVDRRLLPLTAQITEGAKSDQQRAANLEKYLRTTFPYTLELPKEEAADPIAYFLFERKKGHCEYFASSMAVMLRLLGIPSRVVTGLHGGELNPISGWYQIRASDAHSWVEAFISGKGWVTYDPTPYGPIQTKNALFQKIGNYLDAAELFWQDWVMDFDTERQSSLALRLEMAGRAISLPGWSWPEANKVNWRGPLTMLMTLVAILSVVALYPWLRRKLDEWFQSKRIKQGQATANDASALYLRLQAILARHTFARRPDETPLEFGARLPATIAPKAMEATSLYNRLRFGDDAGAGARMLALLLELENYHSATDPSS